MSLVDLHCNWAIQYACESTQYDPALYRDVFGRLTQVDGYLSGVSAAVLACGRCSADWTVQADPWQSVGEMIARYEAEFSGRMLHGPGDAARWLAEPEDEVICWGMLGIEGLDFLIRDSTDVDRLPGLFRQGVRVFQLVASGASWLAGACDPGDDRGLTDLGRSALDGLANLAPGPDEPRPRPVVDLAALNARSTSDVLSWFEADPARRERLPLVRTFGSVETSESSGGSGLTADNLPRLRALGGLVGLSVGRPFVSSPEDLRHSIETVAAVPWKGAPGYAGIGIGSDFLGLEQSLVPLSSAVEVAAWLATNYPLEIAADLIQGSARQLLLRAAGHLRRTEPSACSRFG
jgi:membrane dipeptidase